MPYLASISLDKVLSDCRLLASFKKSDLLIVDGFRLPVPVHVPQLSSTVNHQLFPRGFSARFVFLIWGLFGGCLVYFFLANFRTMLLSPQYEKPINTAQDVVDRGLIPFVVFEGQHYVHLLTKSSNPLYQQLGEITVVPADIPELDAMCRDDIQGANTHVFVGCYECIVIYNGRFGKYHKSKEAIAGTNPYVGNIMNKKWEYGEAYDHHLLLFHQVNLIYKIAAKNVLCSGQNFK